MKNRNLIMSIFRKVLWLILGVVAYFALAQVITVLPLPYWSYADDRPLVNETIEVVGPVPDSEKADIKKQAKYHNNHGFTFASPSGHTVGRFVEALGGLHYFKDGMMFGPIESSDNPEWPVELGAPNQLSRSDEKDGNTLTIESFGSKKNCFDIAVESQVNVLYNGEIVGTEEIKDDKCQSPIEGVLLSDNGLKHAYIVRDRDGFFVVSNGKRSSNYPVIKNLHFEGSTPVFNAIEKDYSNFIRVSMN